MIKKIPKPLLRYNAKYRGILIEVHNFKRTELDEREIDRWTYYIYVSPDHIPDKKLADGVWLNPQYDEKGRQSYDYFLSWLNDLEWHGGITWYSKTSSPDDRIRVAKIGCDYAHLFDDGQFYNERYVFSEACATVDQFIARVPNYKMYCGTVGGYWLPSEGIMAEDGDNFISFKGIEWEKENYPDQSENRWWFDAWSKHTKCGDKL